MSSVFIGVAGRIQCLAIHATQVLCPSSVNAVHLLQGKHISTIYSLLWEMHHKLLHSQ
jgi:hypothetical protein